MTCIIYFDRISINTEIPEEDLRKFLPIEELKSHSLSNRLEIYEVSNTAKYWGYRTRIDAFDATDEFVKTLNHHDLGKCGIWHIEIAKDTACKSFKGAETALFHRDRNIYRNWERNNFTISGEENDTYYRAKTYKVSKDNYIRMYPVPAYSDKNLIKDKPVTHMEFILETWTTIKRVLKIPHISELGTAEEIFNTLQKRYLPEKVIHREKIRKTLIKYGADKDKARYRSEMISDIQDLKDWIGRAKWNVEHKKQVQRLNRSMRGKARIMNRWDKFIMDVDFRCFLKRL